MIRTAVEYGSPFFSDRFDSASSTERRNAWGVVFPLNGIDAKLTASRGVPPTDGVPRSRSNPSGRKRHSDLSHQVGLHTSTLRGAFESVVDQGDDVLPPAAFDALSLLHCICSLGPVRSFAALFDRKVKNMRVSSTPIMGSCLLQLAGATGFSYHVVYLERPWLVVSGVQRFQILQLRADLEVYYGLFFVAWSIMRMNISLSEFLLPAYLYWQLQKLRYGLLPRVSPWRQMNIAAQTSAPLGQPSA